MTRRMLPAFAVLLTMGLQGVVLAQPSAQARELEELRTFSSKTYREPDGSYTASLATGCIHYRDADGSYHDISLELVPVAPDGGEPGYENETNTLRTRFAAERPRMTARGESVSITCQTQALRLVGDDERELSARGATAEADGSTITYREVFPGADLLLHVVPSGVRKELVFHRDPFAGAGAAGRIELVERLELQDGDALLDAAGHLLELPATLPASLQLRGVGAEALRLPQGYAFDSSAPGTPEHLPEMATFTVRRLDEGALELATSISREWFSSAARVYPIVLDPTLFLQPDGAVGKDAQIVLPLTTSNYGSSVNILQNWSSGSTTDSDGLVEFDLTPIPTGSVINTATFEIFHRSGTEPNPIGVFRTLGSWDEATVTWANSPMAAATPTATVPFTPTSVFHAWSVEPDVQDWVDGVATNFGWRVSADGPADNNFAIDARSSDQTVPSERPKLDINYDPGGIDIILIDAPDTVVVAGLGGYQVSMTVENIGPNIVGINTAGLTFTGTADRTSEYTVTPDPGNPTTVASLAQEILVFSVDVDLAATVETITIDGTIEVIDAVTAAIFMDTTAVTTDMWDVISCYAPFCGDCNGDMVLTILDALVAAQHAAALITLTGLDFSNCNVIGTLEPFPGAVVDILDALSLAQAAAGLPVTITCC